MACRPRLSAAPSTVPVVNTGNSTNSIEPTSKVTIMAKLCAAGDCPTVYRTDRDTVVVQGYRVSAAEIGIDLPPDELLVEIPPELLAAAARTLR